MDEAGGEPGETLAQFKDSFSYGSRTDLSFKFLKALTEAEAGEFIAELLGEVGASYDDGDISRIHRVAYEWQVRAAHPKEGAPRRWSYDDRPFAPLPRPLAECRLGLLTSSGHFAAGDDPQPLGVADMTQEEAVARIGEFMASAPVLSEIPVHLPRSELRVRHAGYDIRSTLADPNVAFPIDLLAEAEAEGRIGELAGTAWSFVGATAQGRLRSVVPDWIERLRAERVDGMLLVPV